MAQSCLEVKNEASCDLATEDRTTSSAGNPWAITQPQKDLLRTRKRRRSFEGRGLSRAMNGIEEEMVVGRREERRIV